jgi:hypothetical protein
MKEAPHDRFAVTSVSISFYRRCTTIAENGLLALRGRVRNSNAAAKKWLQGAELDNNWALISWVIKFVVITGAESRPYESNKG